jgi:toxin CptA
MLEITLSPSRILTILLAISHGLTVAIVALLDVPLSARLLGGAVVVVAGAYSIRRDARLLGAQSVREIRAKSDGHVELGLSNGSRATGRWAQGSFVTPVLTVALIRLDSNRKLRRIAILPDMLAADSFRELRIYLKWKATPE